MKFDLIRPPDLIILVSFSVVKLLPHKSLKRLVLLTDPFSIKPLPQLSIKRLNTWICYFCGYRFTENVQKFVLVFRHLALITSYPRWALVFLEKTENLTNFLHIKHEHEKKKNKRNEKNRNKKIIQKSKNKLRSVVKVWNKITNIDRKAHDTGCPLVPGKSNFV